MSPDSSNFPLIVLDAQQWKPETIAAVISALAAVASAYYARIAL